MIDKASLRFANREEQIDCDHGLLYWDRLDRLGGQDVLFSCCNLGKCDVGRWSRGIEGKGNGFFEMVRRVVLGNVIVMVSKFV